jgi:hypothetical protein
MRTIMRTSGFILTTLFSASLLAAGHDLTTSPPTANQQFPVVTGNGSGFTAAWYEPAFSRYRVVSSVVSANGEPIEGGVAAIDQPPLSSIAIAHSPSEALIVWSDGHNLLAERLSPSGMPLSTTVVTVGSDYVLDVAVAWDGNRYFVIWSNGTQLVGTLVAPDGSSTQPRAFFGEPTVVGHRAPAETVLMPDIAWDGRNFIVVVGESPNLPCNLSACPSPPLDGFLVMRVNADGDAVDSSPLLIAGTHFAAHVASSGAEALIALDQSGEVSTIIAHTEDGLSLDAETPLFQWFSNVSSAVAWDGAAYIVGWRYLAADPGPGWLGASHVTRSGLPLDYRFTETARAVRPVSIAVNEAGITAFAIAESPGPPSLLRARLYLASEFTPIPPPPPAPTNVISYFSGTTARIDWQESETPAGFALEWSWDFGKSWGFYTFIPADARTITVAAHIGNLFRVRAFGPGGLSDGPITSIGSMQRRRAERR